MKKEGLTLIELLVTMAIMIVLAVGFIAYVDPVGYFERARDDEREAHLYQTLYAMEQKRSVEGGICDIDIPTTFTDISSGDVDLYDCLHPQYLTNPGIDPSEGYFNSIEDYVSGYEVRINEAGIISLRASGAETREVEVNN